MNILIELCHTLYFILMFSEDTSNIIDIFMGKKVNLPYGKGNLLYGKIINL